MQYSIVRDILGSPWQIEASTFQRFFPLAIGALNGAHFKEEEPSAEMLPMAYSTGAENVTAATQHEDSKIINVQQVRDVILKHDAMCGPVGMRTQGKWLKEADANPSVVGHVLIFESGGGAVNGVPELSEVIAACEKPVIAYVDGLMCSAAMHIGSYCNEIIASRDTDRIGCIGTMLVYQGRKTQSTEDSNMELQVSIYADDSYEKNEEYEKAINEFDVTLAKTNILNPTNAQFISDIKANRPNVEDKHLHGKTFLAKDVEGSLIDSIGSFDMAIERVLELAEYEDNSAQGPEGTGQAANNNSTKKEMKNFGNVNAALGVESLEAVDGTVSLNEEQLGAMDSALAETGAQALQGALETANGTIAERDTTIVALSTQITALQAGPGASTAAVVVASDGDDAVVYETITAEDKKLFKNL